MTGVYNGSGGGVFVRRKAQGRTRPQAGPPPSIDTMDPALVATIIGQAAPLNYWGHDGQNRANSDHMTVVTGAPMVGVNSPVLGGLVTRFALGSADQMRVATPLIGGVGAESFTAILIASPITTWTANRGIFGNRTNSAGNTGFEVEGSPGTRMVVDTPLGNYTVTNPGVLGAGNAEVILYTRSIAADLTLVVNRLVTQVDSAGAGDSLISDRNLHVGAGPTRSSDDFDFAGLIQWIGIDADFGTIADFEAARYAIAQFLGYEA